MRNIFLFIRSYFNLLFFLFLQGFCIYLIVHYNKYHNALFSNSANQITGKLNEQYNKIDDYFNLKKTNDSLIKANEKLINQLKSNFLSANTNNKFISDTINLDSTKQIRRYNYMQAAVVANSTTTQSNYIVLGRGLIDGVKKDMGVVDINSAVVGVVTEVTNDYAVVMSLLHKDSHINGKLFTTGETGSLSWDGKSTNEVSLQGISKSSKIAVNDKVFTSGYSTTFPKGMLIGSVTNFLPEKSNNNFLVKLKTAADFNNLQYVFVIENKQQLGINEILEKAKQINK